LRAFLLLIFARSPRKFIVLPLRLRLQAQERLPLERLTLPSTWVGRDTGPCRFRLVNQRGHFLVIYIFGVEQLGSNPNLIISRRGQHGTYECKLCDRRTCVHQRLRGSTTRSGGGPAALPTRSRADVYAPGLLLAVVGCTGIHHVLVTAPHCPAYARLQCQQGGRSGPSRALFLVNPQQTPAPSNSGCRG
jgi:hypothetical protein